MTEKKNYYCDSCGKAKSIAEPKTAPLCCDREMIPKDETDFCLKGSDPRHARLEDDDMPCDDNRAGNGEQQKNPDNAKWDS